MGSGNDIHLAPSHYLKPWWPSFINTHDTFMTTWVVPRGSYANEYQVCVPRGSRELSRVRLTQIAACCPQYWSGAVTGVAWFIHAKQKTSQVFVTLDLAKRPVLFYQFGSKFLLDFFILACSTTPEALNTESLGRFHPPPKPHPFPVIPRRSLEEGAVFSRNFPPHPPAKNAVNCDVTGSSVPADFIHGYQIFKYISLEAQAFQQDTWMGYFQRHACPHSGMPPTEHLPSSCMDMINTYKLSILSPQPVAVNLPPLALLVER